LFKKNAAIKASKAEKTLTGSLYSVQPHFELTFQSEDFRKQYECLIENIPLSQCGKPVCPTCPKEKPIVKKEETVPDQQYVRYTSRNYFFSDISIPDEVCDDGLDNDLNGEIDCKDTACAQHRSCITPPEICDNGRDDDNDGWTDCQDSDCPGCVEICDNGKDDDFDGKKDCQDSDCPECVEICDNGKDDDFDGKKDCRDSDCPTCEERIERFRIALGVENSQLFATNGDFISWAEFNTINLYQFKASYMLKNRFPIELFGHTSTELPMLSGGTFNLWSAGLGFGYLYPISNNLRVSAVVRVAFRTLQITSTEFNDNFGGGITVLPTVGAQWNIFPNIDLYVEGGIQTEQTIDYDFGTVVNSRGTRFGSGLGISF
jgi:hypothetical protein